MPHNRRLLIATAFLSSSLCCLAQTDSATKAKQILRIEQSLADAIAPGDTSIWNKYLDPKCYTITEDGTGYFKKEFLATFGPLPKGFSGYIKVTHPVFSFIGNTAVIHYVADEYEQVFGQKLHTTYGIANTWVQNGGSWKMIGSQVFEIPQLPPAIKATTQILRSYTGSYQMNDNNTCTISLINDTLFLQKKTGSPVALFAETENVFFRQADTRGRKIFVKNDTGEMLMLERRNGNDLVWKRIK
ncbi:MAG TPA: DUF4440 domain-containing protein [Puia sp.]|nr:DUF4440 domain-containing protein [Puia sp.]